MAGWNGSGTFSRTHDWTQDQANGIKIRADRHDENDVDFVNGINNCLTKDGQNTPSADLPMATYKHTGVGNATARTQYATAGQIADGDLTELGTVAGTDTITAALTPAITAYAQGQRFSFVAANTNTGAVTININSVGAKDITKRGTTALAAGDIVQNVIHIIEYDGTRFQLINPIDTPTLAANNTFTGTNTFSGNVTFGAQILTPNDGELTIASGVITVTGCAHTVDTESDAATDDLDTISGGSTGSIVEFRLENAARDVVFKHGTGNISNPNSANITMGAANDRIYYKYDGSNWIFLLKNFGDSTDFTAGTSQATTSGTAVNFTSLPAGIRRITIMLKGVSLSGTGDIAVRIGDSGGLATTGYSSFYVAGTSGASSSAGFGIPMGDASSVAWGSVVLSLENPSTNAWFCNGSLVRATSSANGLLTSGIKALSGVLDRVSLVSLNGSDTFDAGSVNIIYEL